MKYIDEFRQGRLAKALLNQIQAAAKGNKTYRFMEFCGGHTHAIYRYGLQTLLPSNVQLIHGPGCPVCILPISSIDKAIYLASQPDLILCAYADMMRVPGSKQRSLLKAKAKGGDIRMVYSIEEALLIAKDEPQKQVVFFAIGFETTTPPTAAAILKARQEALPNFSVFCNHVLTPVAMKHLLSSGEVQLDGFIGPAHVSIVIGSEAYAPVCKAFQKPIVIAGFEPLDVLHSIWMLIEQTNSQRYEVENQYTRAVTPTGNALSQKMMAEVFEVRDRFEWRGLGLIPHSALKLTPKYAAYDAEQRFSLPQSEGHAHKQCLCGEVLKGMRRPQTCKLFAKVCTPENPLGACMVSSEGACAAVYRFART